MKAYLYNEMKKANQPAVTVVLTIFDRLDYFDEQLAAINAQSVPADIWVDYTVLRPEELNKVLERYPQLKFSIRWNQNLKYHGRFNYALNADTPYIFICDDDIIPGPKYFEHCIATLKETGDALLTAYGVILDPDEHGYNPARKEGYKSMNKAPLKVDMAGQSMFFPTKLLKYLNQEPPLTRENGEDLHFSYMLQKYAGVPVIVPAHLPNEPDKWGCDPIKGELYGEDDKATWKKTNHVPIRDKIVNTYRKDGWVLVGLDRSRGESTWRRLKSLVRLFRKKLTFVSKGRGF